MFTYMMNVIRISSIHRTTVVQVCATSWRHQSDAIHAFLLARYFRKLKILLKYYSRYQKYY